MNLTPEPGPAHAGVEWDKLIGIEQPGEASIEIVRHLASIRTVAEEFQRPFEEVAHFYREELARLRSRAAITDFLPVLVAKKIRDHYRNTPQYTRDGGA